MGLVGKERSFWKVLNASMTPRIGREPEIGKVWA
jgi:hypothetical protein